MPHVSNMYSMFIFFFVLVLLSFFMKLFVFNYGNKMEFQNHLIWVPNSFWKL